MQRGRHRRGMLHRPMTRRQPPSRCDVRQEALSDMRNEGTCEAPPQYSQRFQRLVSFLRVVTHPRGVQAGPRHLGPPSGPVPRAWSGLNTRGERAHQPHRPPEKKRKCNERTKTPISAFIERSDRNSTTETYGSFLTLQETDLAVTHWCVFTPWCCSVADVSYFPYSAT